MLVDIYISNIFQNNLKCIRRFYNYNFKQRWGFFTPFLNLKFIFLLKQIILTLLDLCDYYINISTCFDPICYEYEFFDLPFYRVSQARRVTKHLWCIANKQEMINISNTHWFNCIMRIWQSNIRWFIRNRIIKSLKNSQITT